MRKNDNKNFLRIIINNSFFHFTKQTKNAVLIKNYFNL